MGDNAADLSFGLSEQRLREDLEEEFLRYMRAAGEAPTVRAIAAAIARVIEAARGGLESPGISVVEPALLAKRLGATALHDPTEGGLAAGLHEMARAAHVGIRVDREAVQWFEPGLALCRSVGVDPWSTLASGSLLAAFHADSTAPALGAFAAQGYAAAAIGSVVAGSGVQGDNGYAIPWPDRDALDGVLYAEGLSRRGDR